MCCVSHCAAATIQAGIQGTGLWNATELQMLHDASTLCQVPPVKVVRLTRLTNCALGAGTGMSTGQGSSYSPFNDSAAQNGMPNQQGSMLQSNPSIVSQPSGPTQQQPSAQPPFLVQYGNNNQGQLPFSL